MEKQQVKLVKSQNGGEEYHILINKVVGKGGFGIVNEARSVENPKQRLVVKTMPSDNENKRKTIENQLKVMSELPLHQNIVRVIPVKMYSADNYYIFMDYCEGGTLYDLYVSKKGRYFEEEQLYDIFYQCMNGYKVLFDKKILHQDIKPENILIRKNIFKLADFGLSIFYEGYDFGDSREGTLSYIAPQKLTVRDYIGNPKSDVYSFGIMFYELIAGYHPYVKTGGRKANYKEFVRQLINGKLRYPANLPSRFSLAFNQFFDLILKMIKKHESNRIGFEQIWNYLKNSDIFQKCRQKQKQLSKQFLIQEYDFVVSEITSVLTLPVNSSEQQQKTLRQQFQSKIKQQNSKMIQVGKQVQNYFIRRRLIVYHLDRLARKLIVDQEKQNFRTQLHDKSILYLMLFTKTLLNDLVKQLKSPTYFTLDDFCAFKRTSSLAFDITSLLRKDHQYVQDQLCQLLSEPSTIPVKQVKTMFQYYKQHDQQTLIKNLIQCLSDLLSSKVSLIEVTNKNQLVTLMNLFTILFMLQDFQNSVNKSEQLQLADKKILICSVKQLIQMIQTNCDSKKFIYGFDVSNIEEDEEDNYFYEEQK